MFIRQYFKAENGQRTAYWALVESYRTKRGPRPRVVALLGKLDEAGQLEVRQAIDSTDTATGLQDKSTRGHDRHPHHGETAQTFQRTLLGASLQYSKIQRLE